MIENQFDQILDAQNTLLEYVMETYQGVCDWYDSQLNEIVLEESF